MDSFVGGFQSQPDPFGQWKNGLNGYRDRERNERHDVYMQNKSHAFQTERDAVQQQYHVSNTVLGTALDIHRDNNNAANTMKQGDRNAHHARVAEGAAHGMRKSEASQAHEHRLHENDVDSTNRINEGRDTARLSRLEAAQAHRFGNKNHERNNATTERLAANPSVASASQDASGGYSMTSREPAPGAATSPSPARTIPKIGSGGVSAPKATPAAAKTKATPRKKQAKGVGAPGASAGRTSRQHA